MEEIKKDKIQKSLKEWKEILDEHSFEVCRLKGTEAPFSGKYNSFYEDGTYSCKCCGNTLFDSKAKFNSHSGWPSFYECLKDSVSFIEDNSHRMSRIEVICSKCDAHLGHIFPDGPAPSGQRFCINSVCLNFEKRD